MLLVASLRRLYEELHDPRLRQPSTYEISRRNTTASGRATSVIRLLCTLLVIGATATALTTQTRWWLAVAAPALVGSLLAILHTRQDLIEAMVQSPLCLLRPLGRQLNADSWTRLNLPGVLETVGPLLMAWMVGSPEGPFAGDSTALLAAAVGTLLYSSLGTLHWITESVFYQPEPTKAWSVGFARLARAAVPALLGLVYGLLLSRNTSGPTVLLPWLSCSFLLLYPATVFYEKTLTNALAEMRPAVVAQRLRDATVVHSSISNPLHYVFLAAKHRPAGDAEPLMIYLRGELQRCLDELDHQHPAATISEIIEGVRNSLLPTDRGRLNVSEPVTTRRLSPMDASLARSILADLCCNALKEVHHGQAPTATVTTHDDQGTLTLRVIDDGPGIRITDGTIGTSLTRLRQLLGQLQGHLSIEPAGPVGTVVTASWPLTRSEP
ncbi:ATP-binding protein [Streptomyces sp. NPDC101133]|uniref:ATP-binding protein n=1 Tax=Streptomyces sp. NPDC101133 TaxID=3366111 RepID=UPI00382FF979